MSKSEIGGYMARQQEPDKGKAESGLMNLLSCPFCGNKAEIVQKGTINKPMIIKCVWCGCSHKSGDVYGLTINLAWNRRVKT